MFHVKRDRRTDTPPPQRELQHPSSTSFAAETVQFLELSLHQRQSLGPTPSLHLLLAQEGILNPVVLLEVQKPNGETVLRVDRRLPLLVLGETAVEVPRAADIERPVAALEDVHEGHSASIPGHRG